MRDYPIIERWMEKSDFTRPGAPNHPEFIVIHYTANPGSTAEQNSRYFDSIPSRNISRAQEILKLAGFNPGAVDGDLGPKTRGALLQFQQSLKIKETGLLDSVTIFHLKAKASSIGQRLQLSYASPHDIIGLDGEIIRKIPHDEVCYCAGGDTYTEWAKQNLFDSSRGKVYPHNKTINVECCHPDESGKSTEATLDSLVQYCSRVILETWGSTFRREWQTRITLHNTITGKDCPRWFVRNPKAFADFHDRVLSLTGEASH